MLKNLMKYDFKWINKVMVIYYILLFVITVAVTIVESMEQTFFLLIVDKILSGMMIGCSISVIITVLMRIWVRYNISFYKDESYLTHTLPATKNELFNSKIITSILSLIIALLFVAVCFFSTYLINVGIDPIKALYNSVAIKFGNVTTNLFIIGVILLVILEMIFILFAGIFGLTLGNRSNNGKTIKSITFGFISYSILNTVSVIIIQILDLFTDFDITSKAAPSIGIIKTLVITGILMYVIYNLAYYLASKRLFNKGVNVE